MRELFDQGLTLDAANRIVELQDQLEQARARIDELEAAQDDGPVRLDDRRDRTGS
jgi:hypothetical protein